jgi:hypothetical protein
VCTTHIVNTSRLDDFDLHTFESLHLHQIRGIRKPIFERHKRILDAPRTDKPGIDVKTPSLIIRPARTRASERLLADHGACALVVVVDVAGGMAEAGRRVQEGVAVRREAAWEGSSRSASSENTTTQNERNAH